MLIENTLFEGRKDKIKIAIERLKTFEPPEGYYLAFSGGKDSVVIKELASISGVKYDAHYNNTTIDPPELVKFIREYHGDVEFHNPKVPFLKEMVKRGFPMRFRRWCCADYKERGGAGRMVVTGIRQAESSKRSGRKMIEQCKISTSKTYLNPIIDWTDGDVWDFIRSMKTPYCSLYDEGWKRLGCVMCPLANPKVRIRESLRYPKYTNAFRKAFHRLYLNKKERGLNSVDRWKDGDEMFASWLYGGDFRDEEPDQMVMFE